MRFRRTRAAANKFPRDRAEDNKNFKCGCIDVELVRQVFKKYLGRGLVLLAVTIASTLLGLLIIEFGRRIVNVVSLPAPDAHGSFRLVVIYSSLMLLTVIASGWAHYLIVTLYTKLSQSVLQDIRLSLFAHILRLPQEFHDRNPVGLIMSRVINDLGYIGQFLSKAFLLPVMNVVTVAFYTAYLFNLNWKLAIVGIIAVPSMVIILPGFSRRLARLSEQYSNSMASMSNYFQEAFSGIGDIRSNQTYFFEESRLKARIRDFFRINLDLAKTTGTLDFLMRFITQFGPFLVYLYGGFLCIRGELAVGTLVATIAVIHSLYDPVDSFVSFFEDWRQVKVRFDKLDEYLRLKPESDILAEDAIRVLPRGDIRFDNVRFGFNEREILLHDIRFTASRGERLAFVGTSGSGKSLTAALLSRIYNPLGGKIIVGDNDINSVPLYDLRSQIGYVSQAPFLFNDSIKNNILYALLRKNGGDSDRFEDWIDLSRTEGIDTLEKLDGEMIRVVREVGLFEDIYELGLRSQLNGTDGGVTEEARTKVLQARRLFIREMAGSGPRHVEHYEEDRFLEYCTLLENIVFCPLSATIEGFGTIREFTRQYLNAQMRRLGLLERLFLVGAHLAREDSLLLERLRSNNSPLLDHLGLSRDEIDTKMKVSEKMALLMEGPPAMDRIDAETAADVLDLAYCHVPGRSKENLVDDTFKNDLLSARKLLREALGKRVRGKPGFFSRDDYIESGSIRENIIFGNVDPSRKRANEIIDGLVRKAVREAGIEDQVIGNGLAFNVGERGNRLSGGQKQKVAIARILLKNPSILILDEATASLDSASQALITELVREKLAKNTVISIAHRLNTIRDYDKILVFDKGQIVEQGTFEELIDNEGLFSRLFHESN